MRIHTTNRNYENDLDNLKFWSYPRRGSVDDRPYIESLIKQLPETLWFRATEEYNNEYLKSGGTIANEKLKRFVAAVLLKMAQDRGVKTVNEPIQRKKKKTGARVRIKSKK